MTIYLSLNELQHFFIGDNNFSKNTDWAKQKQLCKNKRLCLLNIFQFELFSLRSCVSYFFVA